MLALLALPALADPPADAPVVLRAGEVAPVDGLLLPDAAAIQAAQRLAACEARVPVLEAGVRAAPPWWVLPVVAVVAAGIGVGVGLSVRR